MKKLLIVCLEVVLILFIVFTEVNAFEFTRHSPYVQYGTQELSVVGSTPSEVDTYQWGGVGYGVSGPLLSRGNWDIEMRPTLGIGFLQSEIASSASVEARLMFDIRWRFLYTSLGGGFAHLFTPKEMPDLADSWIYGLITFEAGFRVLDKDTLKVDLGFWQDHVSSPLHHESYEGDTGWNVGGVKCQVVVPF